MVDRKTVGVGVCGVVAGFVLGGILWGGKAPTVTETKTVEVQRTVEVVVERTVTVERTVIVKVQSHADKVETHEVHHPDGTITIDSTQYNLGVNSTTQENSQTHVSDTSHISLHESAKTENKTLVSPDYDKFMIGGVFFTTFQAPLSFDYKTDWQVYVSKRLWSSPFWGTITAGPKQLGLGLSFSF